MTPQSPTPDAWIALLEEHRVLLDALQEAGQSKQRALVKLDRVGLEAANRREEDTLRRAEALDLRRRELIARTAEALGVPAGSLTVDRIARQVPADAQASLRSLHDAVQRQAKSLRRVNRLNRALVEQSLAHSRDFFQILSGQGPGEATYSRSGLDRKPGGGTLLIDRVA